MPDEEWPDGPVVLGVGWKFSEALVCSAAQLTAALGAHRVCSSVDPASYLTAWEPERERTGLSLDPAVNEETDYPATDLQQQLGTLLGKPGETWSFRVLNGDVARALGRLAENTGASLVVVGADRPRPLARVDRLVEGSVPGHHCHRLQRRLRHRKRQRHGRLPPGDPRRRSNLRIITLRDVV